MRTLKRLFVLLPELAAEAFLLGVLLGGLLFPHLTRLISGVWALAFAVGVVLFLHGYYLTRAFIGLFWRGHKWLYPAIAAALFVMHMHIAIARSKNDLTPFAQATEFPFLAGGACIVFACAFLGDRFLRKWMQAVK
ncbi:MAG: hypothetical protein LAO31_23245 [Acidobacteriia bacterium]|nr:hypothetical protein [Terriglobia bacterium]